MIIIKIYYYKMQNTIQNPYKYYKNYKMLNTPTFHSDFCPTFYQPPKNPVYLSKNSFINLFFRYHNNIKTYSILY